MIVVNTMKMIDKILMVKTGVARFLPVIASTAKQSPFIATIILSLTLITTTAHAIPGITVEGVRSDFATALYNETATDMRVKVMGGFVEAKRSWYNNRWVFNYAWADLKFEFKTSKSNTSGQPDEIRQHLLKFELVDSKAAILVWRFSDQRRTITKTTTGYRWENRSGDFKDYDNDGKILKYGNKYNVSVSFTRDLNGQIKEIKDHTGKVIITYEFSADDNVSRIFDYSGREVIYTYDTKGLLTNVKDVMGYNWKYGYTDYSSKNYTGPGNLFSITNLLSSKTNPEGHVTKFNYTEIGGGTFCSPTGNGYWKLNSSTGQEEYIGDCIYITTPVSIILSSINYPDGRSQKYTYTYYGSSKTYSKVSRNASNHLVEETVDLEGTVTRRLENGKEVYSLTKDGTSEIITDGRGNKTRTDFDQWRNPTKVTYADGSFKTWKYEPKFSNVIEEVNENGVMTKYEYNANGNMTKMTEAVGFPEERVTEYAYDVFGNRTLLRRVGDSVTQTAETKWTYDGFGNVKTATDAELNVTTYVTYDALGNNTELKDGRGKIWKQGFDFAGNQTSTTNPLNFSSSATYDKVGKKISTINLENKETKFTYNIKGQLEIITDALLSTSKVTYDTAGRLSNITDAENKITKVTYDSEGRSDKTIDGNNNITQKTYLTGTSPENKRLLASVIYPVYRVEYKYNNKFNRTQEITYLSDTETKITEYGYDGVGNLTSVKDAELKLTQYEYDHLNRISKIIYPDLKTSTYLYDNRNNLLNVVNEKQIKIRSYTYDRKNNVKTETWPTGKFTESLYDANNNKIQSTDNKGQITKNRFDDAGRLDQKTYYINAAETTPIKTVSFSYNKMNILTGYDDGITSAIYSIDDIQRKTAETINFGPFSKSIKTTFYKNSIKKTFTDPSNAVNTYYYDAGNRLSQINISDEGSIIYNQYKWNAPTKITYPGGLNRTVDYDAIMRTKHINNSDSANNSLMDYVYEYDKAGNIKTKTTEHGVYVYGYDDRYRLTTVDNPVVPSVSTLVDEAYSYDDAGNRLTNSSTTGNWVYNDTNQLKSNSELAIDYDDNGSTIKKTKAGVITTFDYNTENRLEVVKDSAGVTVATYYYDPFGRRLYKDVAGVKTYFMYATEGLVAELNSAGDVNQSYGYKPQSTYGTSPLYTKTSTGYAYYQLDHLGTPQQLVNKSGLVVWKAKALAFGDTTVEVSTVTNNLRFPGQYFDEETGTHYNYFRDYDSSTGRYVQSDPIGLDGGLNSYVYVYNNPLIWTDSLGLDGRANNPWNQYQKDHPGNTPSQNSGPYRQDQNNRMGAGNAIPVNPTSPISIITDGADIACKYTSDVRASIIKQDVENAINNTSSCQTLYWQVNYRRWATGCTSHFELHMSTVKSKAHRGIMQLGPRGTWKFVRGQSQGKK